MASKIHIVRHAESTHNVPTKTSPSSTQNSQLWCWVDNFFSPSTHASDYTSCFPNVLDKRYYEEDLGNGVEDGAELILDPDRQEQSALPCGTGSSGKFLETLFPKLDFSTLGEEWPTKEGVYSADNEAMSKKAQKVRDHVRDRVLLANDNNERKDVVIVTHGVFMKFLVDDHEIDLPKARWKTFTIEETQQGGAFFVLV